MEFGRVQRRPEIDALRGVFLVWKTLAHLPTHLSDLVNQPLGFISSAEGFVFLSALLVARLYIWQAAEKRGCRADKALEARNVHIRLSPDPPRLCLHHGCRFRRDSAQACADQPAQLLSGTSASRHCWLPSAHLLSASARYLADVRDLSADHAISAGHCGTSRVERHTAGQRVRLIACAVRPACVGSRCDRSHYHTADSAAGHRLL